MICEFSCKAILFDMDGTLVNSTKAVEAIWSEWAARNHVDVDHILAISHGRRTVDTLRDVAPHLDLEAEAHLLEGQEIEWRDGVEEVAGARALITGLPADRWAVVTSASRVLAEARLHMAGLPIPRVLVCSDDVVNGKPHPEGYLRAADALGVEPADCLVLEDTPAGIGAGLAAGMQVLALTTTYPASSLMEATCIADFKGVKVTTQNGIMTLHA